MLKAPCGAVTGVSVRREAECISGKDRFRYRRGWLQRLLAVKIGCVANIAITCLLLSYMIHGPRCCFNWASCTAVADYPRLLASYCSSYKSNYSFSTQRLLLRDKNLTIHFIPIQCLTLDWHKNINQSVLQMGGVWQTSHPDFCWLIGCIKPIKWCGAW